MTEITTADHWVTVTASSSFRAYFDPPLEYTDSNGVERGIVSAYVVFDWRGDRWNLRIPLSTVSSQRLKSGKWGKAVSRTLYSFQDRGIVETLTELMAPFTPKSPPTFEVSNV